MPNVYDKGDLVRCSGAFTDAAGDACDPTGVVFKFQDPSGNETTYTYGTDSELVKDSVGNYHVDVDTDEVGYWYYRFEGTGTGQAAGEASFIVRETEF